MSKKLMKLAMIGSFVFCLTNSTSAMDIKNSFGASGFFGQYSIDNISKRNSKGSSVSGEKASTTKFDNIYSAEIASEISEGKISAGVSISADSSDKGQIGLMSIDEDDYEVSETAAQAPFYPNAWVKFQATESISVMISSSLEAPGLTGFTATSGLGSELTFDKGIIHGLSAYTDNPGLQVEYEINPYLGIYFDVYSEYPLGVDAVQTQYAYDFAKNQFKNGVTAYTAVMASQTPTTDGCLTCMPSYIMPEYYGGSLESGNGMSISMEGALAENIYIGAGYVIGTADQYDGGPTDSGTAMQMSLWYGITGDMSITADYGTRNVTVFNGHKQLVSGSEIDGKIDSNSIGLAFEMGIGPGKAALYYHSSNVKVEFLGAEREDLSNSQTETTVKYDIDLCKEKKCGVTFFYLNNVNTPVDSKADATTQSFIGAKLFAKY